MTLSLLSVTAFCSSKTDLLSSAAVFSWFTSQASLSRLAWLFLEETTHGIHNVTTVLLRNFPGLGASVVGVG